MNASLRSGTEMRLVEGYMVKTISAIAKLITGWVREKAAMAHDRLAMSCELNKFENVTTLLV